MNLYPAEFIETKLFLKYKTRRPDIFCGITKKGSLSYSFHTTTTEEEREKVKNSRALLLEKLGFNNLVTLKQTHSDIIKLITKENIFDYISNPYIVGDGLITKLKDVLIGVSTADCVPVIFISKTHNAIGIAHAGWRGINCKIHLKMLEEFKKLPTKPEDLEIIIGPHNRVCSYEVGRELMEIFPEKYFSLKDNKIFLNLEAIVAEDLSEKGVKNISSINLCSFCNNDLLYSYRRGEERGRNLSFVGIQA
ncbi:MAG: peptidoglycan editing factor PgeF [Brevinematales bacterium]|nr:peptidoglycan editing factor PgeF [Brevinematales bacterium]